MWNRFLKSYVIIASFMTALLLLMLGTQTMTKKPTPTAYKGSIFNNTTIVEPVVTSINIPIEESTTTTSTTIAEVITTVPETTTTEVVITTVTTRVPRTTTTKPYIAPTIPETRAFDSGGPPRNTTTLVGCIAYYESHWGDISANVFQFELGTWQTYGGKGSPANAVYSTQEVIFWLAWEDDGHHHWAAQKGRCF